MRHCCEFDAFDIWYLKDNEEFSNRTLFIGDCPICGKHVCVLSQRKIKTNAFMSVKKVGESTADFICGLIKDKLYAKSDINKMKFASKPFGWRYGVNKIASSKNGDKTIEQYAVDFNGNSELIKKL